MIGGGDCLSAISITVKYVTRPVRNLASLAAIDHFRFTTGTFPFSFSLLLARLTLDHDVESKADLKVARGLKREMPEKTRIFTWIQQLT